MSEREPTQHEKMTEAEVLEDLQRQPLVFMRLAENALTVAESFRSNYLKNTADFISKLRRAIRQPADERDEPILTVHQVAETTWADVSGEVVTFIDGGVGRAQLSSQAPVVG